MCSRQAHLCLWLMVLLLIGPLQAMDQERGPTAAETTATATPERRFAQTPGARMGELSYSRFISEVERGRVRSVTMTGPRITAQLSDGRVAQIYVPDSDQRQLVRQLEAHDVAITARPERNGASLASALIWLFPIALLIAAWIFVMRQMQGAGGDAMEFKKSKARQLSRGTGRTRFNDVAGIDEARDDLQEIVEFLRDPGKFLRLGGRIPSGVLLIGQPGTGKTLVARAVAGEAQVPFFSISGSEFVEMFVGVGASRVRDMFEEAKKTSPCIIFIDEIDALGRKRGLGMGGGHDEREQTLNQLLVEMDGFEPNNGVILIAATNRPDVLDPALLRPGRFDRQVVVPHPDLAGREQILRVHTRKVPLGADVDLKVVARGTPGFSGAQLANLVNEAALLSARRSRLCVTSAEFEDAKDKLIMGAARGSMVMSEEEKQLAAYHESGHALVALQLPASDPVHKVTIIPRAQSLGMMVRLPERDRFSTTRAKCRADIAVAMGGRVAEELIFGAETITSSAQADIEAATNLARAMVTRFGMSRNLGPLAYGGGRAGGLRRPAGNAPPAGVGPDPKSRRRRSERDDRRRIPGCPAHPHRASRRAPCGCGGLAGIRNIERRTTAPAAGRTTRRRASGAGGRRGGTKRLSGAEPCGSPLCSAVVSTEGPPHDQTPDQHQGHTRYRPQ
jgi:cell division protease FtsH